MGFVKILSLSLAATAVADAATILSPRYPNDVIPNEYIVVMKDGVSSASFASHSAWVADMHYYNHTKRALPGHGIQEVYDIYEMKAYSGKFDEDTIQRIAKEPDVAFIEPNQIVTISEISVQKAAPSWGLPRISVKENQLSSNTDYFYDSSAGAGIWVYVVDTGVDIKHPDFEGRAVWGTSTVDRSKTDRLGHGTHVAGTIASKTYGVAKAVKIIAVKVFKDRTTSYKNIIGGIDWAVKHAKKNNMLSKSVVNMSLGGGRSSALNMAAANAHKAGMFVAVSAGNTPVDAMNFSPASEPLACTVAASDKDDMQAQFSAFGPAVDIFAPGTDIVSLVPRKKFGTKSGTSMAAAHVSGAGAYIMALEKIPGNEVCNRLKELAQSSIVRSSDKTTRKLLYNNSGK
uniref:Oryzin n=1 Tax=Coccidioides posadasii RMSCC 3488 TaxID=454284 RepID=A0A0J6FED9_COCPO|nr:oryzin [Coccidioides posadasii RMSCC 3488]